MSEKPITRRDFLNGMALVGAAAAFPGCATNRIISALSQDGDDLGPYPPSLMGLRGSHPGAFEEAHAFATSGKKDWGSATADPSSYDLIVIGAGLSGLSSAYFYRQTINRNARILILDNHDDFGGHAKRNEFTVDGRTFLSYGGVQAIERPSDYSKVARGLLDDLGIDLKQFETAYDKSFFARNGMGEAVFFDPETFGQAKLVHSRPPRYKKESHYTLLPGLKETPDVIEVLDQMPLSERQRAKVREVIAVSPKAYTYFSGESGIRKLLERNYAQFLQDVYGIHEPALIALLGMPLADDFACGGTSVLLWDAVDGGLYGLPPKSHFKGQFTEERNDTDEYLYHFPDGNATIARLLVSQLIPNVAKVKSSAQCVTTRFKYSQLDRPENSVRIRLSSLAVHCDNEGDGTLVRYVRNGKLFEARAKHTVMAGWHMMASHIIPSLPSQQREAMRANIKMPLVYSQVMLRQWEPIKRSGVGTAYCPSSYFQYQYTDFPVNLGEYQPRREPGAPMTVFMLRMPLPYLADGKPADLFRMGRAELLGTSFATFETNIRKQLTQVYGPFGFDADRDIAGITVNRWPHGYIYWHNMIDGKPANEVARARHGKIVIANSDAAGDAYTNAAIDMAWRAVEELKALG